MVAGGCSLRHILWTKLKYKISRKSVQWEPSRSMRTDRRTQRNCMSLLAALPMRLTMQKEVVTTKSKLLASAFAWRGEERNKKKKFKIARPVPRFESRIPQKMKQRRYTFDHKVRYIMDSKI